MFHPKSAATRAGSRVRPRVSRGVVINFGRRPREQPQHFGADVRAEKRNVSASHFRSFLRLVSGWSLAPLEISALFSFVSLGVASPLEAETLAIF